MFGKMFGASLGLPQRVLFVVWFLGLGTAVLVLSGSASIAAPVHSENGVEFYLKQNTFPSGLDEEAIYLDGGSGMVLTGSVGSQTGNPKVSFTSTDSITGAQGLAVIKGVDGALYSDVKFQIENGWLFGDLIFSINIAPESQLDLPTGYDLGDVQVRVTAYDALGAALATYAGFSQDSDWVNGQNDILTLHAIAGLTAVLIETFLDNGVDNPILGFNAIDETKQYYVSDVHPVPLPAALPLFLSGLCGMGYLARRQRRKSAELAAA